jgi:transcriptional regulator with XRE-family HTH domain
MYALRMLTGERIRDLRKSKGFTQAKLAELAGTQEVSIRRWEGGKRPPGTESLLALASALHTTAAYLLGETDDPAPWFGGRPPLDDFEAIVGRRVCQLLTARQDPKGEPSTDHHFSQWKELRGEGPFTYQKAKEISEKLGTTLSFLIGDTDDPDRPELAEKLALRRPCRKVVAANGPAVAVDGGNEGIVSVGNVVQGDQSSSLDAQKDPKYDEPAYVLERGEGADKMRLVIPRGVSGEELRKAVAAFNN